MGDINADMRMVDVPRTQGALLLGGLFAAGLSGMVAVQTVVYFKLYPLDSYRLKTLVLFIWALDMVHTGLTWSAIWEYLIMYYAKLEEMDRIPLSLPLTIVFTAFLTFLVHCFYAHRIFVLSKMNWSLIYPIVIVDCSLQALLSMWIRLGSFSAFTKDFRWLFSLGLALSSAADILVTLLLFALLQNSRSQLLSLDRIIDSLILYTFETGSLTCAGTVVSMICWLTMPHNLIFMGLHFVIAKLYANSALASLNTRYGLRYSHSSRIIMPGIELAGSSDSSAPNGTVQDSDTHTGNSETSGFRLHVQIDMEKTVQYDDGEEMPRL